jgi:hypothetical protein
MPFLIVNIDQSNLGKWTVRVFAIKDYGPQINPTATALQSHTCVRYPIPTLSGNDIRYPRTYFYTGYQDQHGKVNYHRFASYTCTAT